MKITPKCQNCKKEKEIDGCIYQYDGIVTFRIGQEIHDIMPFFFYCNGKNVKAIIMPSNKESIFDSLVEFINVGQLK